MDNRSPVGAQVPTVAVLIPIHPPLPMSQGGSSILTAAFRASESGGIARAHIEGPSPDMRFVSLQFTVELVLIGTLKSNVAVP